MQVERHKLLQKVVTNVTRDRYITHNAQQSKPLLVQRKTDNVSKEYSVHNNKGERQNLPKDCWDIKHIFGNTKSAKYTIYPTLLTDPVDVYCDLETDKGGWTVIQRHGGASVDFYRDWGAYRSGFGDIKGDFWLGNDIIHAITNQSEQRLRIDLGDWQRFEAYAKYDHFHVDSEPNKYRLTVDFYSGTAGDSFNRLWPEHNGCFFSTYDHDNDLSFEGNCAQRFQAGFWFSDCFEANLNGPYSNSSRQDSNNYGIYWVTWHDDENLKFSEMKIRPRR